MERLKVLMKLPEDRPPSSEMIEEYKKVSDQLKALPNRESINSLLESIITDPDQTEVSSDFRQLVIYFELGEMIHISFVKEACRRINLETDHDWSKDHYYVFVLLGRFGCKIPQTDEDFNRLFIEEVNRHYELEPHHHEYEKYHDGKECSDDDICEMAIDKLTRNVVACKGGMDNEVMKRYEPAFILGDKDAKLRKYWEYVDEHKQMIMDIYQSHIKAAIEERGEW